MVKQRFQEDFQNLAEAPFIKVEATRFTEVGYVGRDVEQIVRDLIEIAIAMEREKKRKEVKAKAQQKQKKKFLMHLSEVKQVLLLEKVLEKVLEVGILR